MNLKTKLKKILSKCKNVWMISQSMNSKKYRKKEIRKKTN